MGKFRQLSPELWPMIDVILFSYIELFFRGGVSCLPAALLLLTFLCHFPSLERNKPNVCQTTPLFLVSYPLVAADEEPLYVLKLKAVGILGH